MKKLLMMLLILVVSISFAKTVSIGTHKHGFEIKSNTNYELTLNYGVSSFQTDNFSNQYGSFSELNFNTGYKNGVVGDPALPQFNEMIEFPAGAEIKAEIIDAEIVEYDLSELGIDSPLAPVQPSYSKSTPPEEIKFIYNQNSYNENKWFGDMDIKAEKMGVMRGVGVARLTLNPISYNPVTNKIKVMKNVDLRVSFVGGDLSKKSSEYSPFFQSSLETLINYKKPSLKDDLTNYPVTYLIIASDQFEGNEKLQEFIDWKTMKGFNVVTNFVTSSQSYTDIDGWIEDQYDTIDPKPSFILVVGDMDGSYMVQTKSSGLSGGVSVSDLEYGVIGSTNINNHLPSMYYGRFSTRSETELAAQVDKTIWYEKKIFEEGDPSYLANAMGAAGADAGHQASHGNPHIHYAMDYYFNDTYLNPQTNEPVNINGIGYFDGATGFDDEIIQHVADGVAYYNYTAHGSNTSFGHPSFEISDIDGLGNSGKYGLVIGNCCLTGSFGTTECFGEAWLNAEDQGSIGFIGASASTYWDEDLAMGVGEPAVGNTTPVYSPDKQGMVDGVMMMNYPTQAGIMNVGLLAVDAMASSRIMYYWEAYHLFGDPSVMINLGVPDTQEDAISHSPTIVPGTETYEVEAYPGSYVALSDEDGVLHGAAVCDDSGVAIVEIEPFFSGNGILVVTTQFKQPWIESIPVVPLEGPYPVKEDVVVNTPVYNSNSTVDLALKNIGNQPSEETIATISSESDHITIYDGSEDFGTIATDEIKTIADAFDFDIVDGVTDQTEITVALNVENNYGGKQLHEYSFKFKVDAPSLAIGSIMIEDPTGNNDGMLDPGETVTLSVPVSNIGHAATVDASATISTTNEYVTITNSVSNLGSIDFENFAYATYELTASAEAPIGTPLLLTLYVDAGEYDVEDVLGTTIGVTSAGFESGSFGDKPWEFNENPWVIADDDVNSGNYSAKSGTITHDQASEISLALIYGSEGYVKFSRKVSSEGSYDKLHFFIDETEIAEWSGEEDWAEFEYTVPEGEHILRWVYSKDGTQSSGTDCAWIDDIETTGALAPFYATPMNLTAETIDENDVVLNWDAPQRLIATMGKPEKSNDKYKPETRRVIFVKANPSKELSGYRIYRDETQIDDISAGEVTYTDMDLNNGIFDYYVTALYSDPGESDPSNIATAYVGISPVTVFEDNFETTKGWILEGEFEIGSPTGLGGEHGNPDPTSAFEGSNVLGVDLTGLGANSGDYEADLGNRAYTAESPAFNCGNAEDLVLSFQRYLNVESPSYDHAYIDIWNGSDWQEVWTNEAAVGDADWSLIEVDISDIADGMSEVKIRFAMGETDGSWFFSGWNIDNLKVTGLGTVDISENLPERFTVYQNYPNPFNPTTSLKFFTNVTADVKISIFNVNGQLVDVVANGSYEQGFHTVKFNGENLNSGVYYYQVQTGKNITTKKMIMIK